MNVMQVSVMRPHCNPILAFGLALILVLTAQSMAVARGAAAAVGQMELCVGQGVVQVPIDADGNPTTAPHVCPDCAFAGLQAIPQPPAELPRSLGIAKLYWHEPGGLLRTGAQKPAYLSRAPPVIL